jgi:hypothetical protein
MYVLMLELDDREAEQFLEWIIVAIIVEEGRAPQKKVSYTFFMCLYKKERTAEHLISSPFTNPGNILSFLPTAK